MDQNCTLFTGLRRSLSCSVVVGRPEVLPGRTHDKLRFIAQELLKIQPRCIKTLNLLFVQFFVSQNQQLDFVDKNCSQFITRSNSLLIDSVVLTDQTLTIC